MARASAIFKRIDFLPYIFLPTHMCFTSTILLYRNTEIIILNIFCLFTLYVITDTSTRCFWRDAPLRRHPPIQTIPDRFTDTWNKILNRRKSFQSEIKFILESNFNLLPTLLSGLQPLNSPDRWKKIFDCARNQTFNLYFY